MINGTGPMYFEKLPNNIASIPAIGAHQHSWSNDVRMGWVALGMCIMRGLSAKEALELTGMVNHQMNLGVCHVSMFGGDAPSGEIDVSEGDEEDWS